MKVMDTVKQWVEQHTPSFPWSDTLWHSASPQVRPTALDRTYEYLDEHEREVRETLNRLEAEVQMLRSAQETGITGAANGTH